VLTIDKEQQLRSAIALFGKDVYRFALGQVCDVQAAEDITQEVFEALYREGKKFEGDAHLKNWLLRVTSNRCKRLFRKRKNSREVLQGFLEDLDCTVASRDDTAKFAEYQEVWECVRRLPELQREIIYLYYVEGYNTREIASIVQSPESTVRTRLRRARMALFVDLGEWQ